jgi:hypothetical protein
MKKKKENRGGYRKNAKRPLKYGEETVSLNIRVPKSRKAEIKKEVDSILVKYVST